MKTLKNYRLSNRISGQELATYCGEDEQDALESLAGDAGYESYAAMCKIVGGIGEIVATEINDDRDDLDDDIAAYGDYLYGFYKDGDL